MGDLVDAGWKVTELKNEEEIKDIDMKAMFDDAEVLRRNSKEIVDIPKKVGKLYVLVIHYSTKTYLTNKSGNTNHGVFLKFIIHKNNQMVNFVSLIYFF